MTVRQDTNATALIERLHTSERIRKMSQARVVTPRAELPGEALIGETCLYFVPDNPDMPLHTDVSFFHSNKKKLAEIMPKFRRNFEISMR